MNDKIKYSLHHPFGRPFTGAAILAGGYIIISMVYIHFSSLLAERFAQDIRTLNAIETIKGIAFVQLTGILLFILCYRWLRWAQRQNALLIKSERRAVAGICSASIAHDLNNLLMGLCGFLDTVEEQASTAPILQTACRDLSVGFGHLGELSKALTQAARDLEPHSTEQVNLDQRLHLLVRLLAKHPDIVLRHLELHCDQACRLNVNATLFDQAIMNLVINAGQAAGFGGKILIEVVPMDQTIDIHVHDSGLGIATENERKLFKPGFTTKKNGSGLGLLSVRAFATSCNGDLTLGRSDLFGGALFTIHIPRTACAAG